EIVLSKGGKEVVVIDTRTNKRVTVPTGAYDVAVKDKPEGIEVKADRIVVSRGKETLVTIERADKATRQPAEARPRGQADEELILGIWKPIEAKIQGEAVPAAVLEALGPTLTFTRDKLTVNVDPRSPFSKLHIEAVYHLDAAKSPKTIDIIYL